jgi:hypothetical protein
MLGLWSNYSATEKMNTQNVSGAPNVWEPPVGPGTEFVMNVIKADFFN